MVEYILNEDVKKKLGYIVREERKIKFKEVKNQYLIENNPYTKENFCENNQICHYHTLTKLENDTILEDDVYHVLLKKLGLFYQVTLEEHMENMELIDRLSKDLLHAGEYIDDNLVNDIKQRVETINFEKDCVAAIYLKVIEFYYSLQLLIKVEDSLVDYLEKYIEFFDGVHKGLINHCFGIYYLNRLKFDLAKDYFLRAQKIYLENNVSKGLINSYIIAVDVYTHNYYAAVPLCNEMEAYYFETNNHKRLMHVYNYLSEYYLLISAYEVAKDYSNRAIKIIDSDKSLERFKYSLYYNWGLRCFKNYNLEEALENFILSYKTCINNIYKLQIINLIMIIMTKLHYSESDIKEYCELGENYYAYGNELNQFILKYFKFKTSSSRYYRRYATDKIIPILTADRSKTEILLFFYEDLYKS